MPLLRNDSEEVQSAATRRSDGGSTQSAEPDDQQPFAACAGAVQTSRNHLNVCLKLLALLYRNDDSLKEPEVGTHVHRENKLYLSTIMLNSALLKAMHVADSFWHHCSKEFPNIAPAGGDSSNASALAKNGRGDGGEASGKDSAAQYRRLQAECVMLAENLRHLELQCDADKERASSLEEDCASLREKKARLRDPEAESPRSNVGAEFESDDIALLQKFGMPTAKLKTNGALLAEAELERLVKEVQGFRDNLRDVQQEAASEAKRKEQAQQAEQRAVDAASERRELQQLLGASGDDADSLLDAMKQLFEEEQAEARASASAAISSATVPHAAAPTVSTLQTVEWEERAAQELELQGLDQRCQDLRQENEKLRDQIVASYAESAAALQPGSGGAAAIQQQSQQRRGRRVAYSSVNKAPMLPLDDDATSLPPPTPPPSMPPPPAVFADKNKYLLQSGALTTPEKRSGRGASELDGSRRSHPITNDMGSSDRSTASPDIISLITTSDMERLRSMAQPPPSTGSANSSVLGDDDLENGLDFIPRGKASHGTGRLEYLANFAHPRRPFVVCNSVQSHHATSQAVVRSRRGGSYSALFEDKQLAKGVSLRGKSAGDTLGRLSSLIGSSNCSSLTLGAAAAAAAAAAVNAEIAGGGSSSSSCPAPCNARSQRYTLGSSYSSPSLLAPTGSVEVPVAGAALNMSRSAVSTPAPPVGPAVVATVAAPAGVASPPVPAREDAYRLAWDRRQSPRSPSPRSSVNVVQAHPYSQQPPRQQSPHQQLPRHMSPPPHMPLTHSPRPQTVPPQRPQPVVHAQPPQQLPPHIVGRPQPAHFSQDHSPPRVVQALQGAPSHGGSLGSLSSRAVRQSAEHHRGPSPMQQRPRRPAQPPAQHLHAWP